MCAPQLQYEPVRLLLGECYGPGEFFAAQVPAAIVGGC
jgi:hypothetical protein